MITQSIKGKGLWLSELWLLSMSSFTCSLCVSVFSRGSLVSFLLLKHVGSS